MLNSYNVFMKDLRWRQYAILIIIIIGQAPITQVNHVRNKNSNFQERSLSVIKVIFHIIRNCL